MPRDNDYSGMLFQVNFSLGTTLLETYRFKFKEQFLYTEINCHGSMTINNKNQHFCLKLKTPSCCANFYCLLSLSLLY